MITPSEKPVLYLIGDSTVAGASATNPIQGWGGKLISYFDESKINVQNRAVSGISSRTYQTSIVHDPSMLKNGMWKGIMEKLKAGDFVMMQFGHNDESPVADTLRMRGSLKGIGDTTVVVTNYFTKQKETVQSYGFYLKKLVSDIQSRKAIAIICSPIPKNKWSGNRIIRNNNDYGKWAKEVAEQTGACFIDLNQLMADQYDRLGQAEATRTYFNADGVHTTQAGAQLSASLLASAIKKLSQSNLKSYLNPNQ